MCYLLSTDWAATGTTAFKVLARVEYQSLWNKKSKSKDKCRDSRDGKMAAIWADD
jgi:hypothetical protein